MLSNMECQPQRDPFSDFGLVYFLVEAENVVGAGEFNLMCFMTGQQSSSRGSLPRRTESESRFLD